MKCALESCQTYLTWAQTDVVARNALKTDIFATPILQKAKLTTTHFPSITVRLMKLSMYMDLQILVFIYYCHSSVEDLYRKCKNNNFKKKIAPLQQINA